ncbi:3-oxoacyl-[acyl-carrier-protein] reductase FabG [Maioricimonas rarisocia]|uniref:3-oxoacyl-[acyl-carrier-protein] reductase FabG n=1 Tax=Maioricimonas rarisocia TaxID=2528026 RepID=A0A517Z3I2_9PLAN|nr:SDR family oxidoreductase [Maioricimonas rarisocia]QDU37039.1 3-oxoacyl-[acyl-carrier-protein] reductase FabG [Maioricimonas rarisocia]
MRDVHAFFSRQPSDFRWFMDSDTSQIASSFAALSGRRAVVTGASSGIGRAIALEFARAGADVLVHYRRSADAAEQTARDIENLGRRAVTLSADLGDPAALEPFVSEACNRLGEIDTWVNNAGVDLLTGPDADLPYDQKLQRLLDIDVRSSALLCRLVGQRMQAQGRGVLLNIGWDQADRGMEGDSGELFAAAKNAVMGLTRSLAVSLAPQVRVNCIAPGWIKTAWGETASDVWQQRVLRETPLRRWGTPEDIARLARFLASDDAGYLTGQVINANGGAIR